MRVISTVIYEKKCRILFYIFPDIKMFAECQQTGNKFDRNGSRLKSSEISFANISLTELVDILYQQTDRLSRNPVDSADRT